MKVSLKSLYVLWLLQLLIRLIDSRKRFPSSSKLARYDKNINLFSPDGRLLQVEYAHKAGAQSDLILCAASSDGEVVVCTRASEPSILIESPLDEKLVKIDKYTYAVFSGLKGDALALTKQTRQFSVDYHTQLAEFPTAASIARFVADFQHESSLLATRRPYGIQFLVIGLPRSRPINRNTNRQEMGVTESRNSVDGIGLHLVEPSGSVSSWQALAMGKQANEATKRLQSLWRVDLNTAEVTRALTNVFAEMDQLDAMSEWNCEEKEEKEKEKEKEKEEEARCGKRTRSTTTTAAAAAEHLSVYVVKYNPEAQSVCCVHSINRKGPHL